jgi:predicted secreted protein
MRRLVLAIIAFFALASAAAAGDYADREIIGFSPDGRFFAFEEYGMQDGSGFPYSNIYLIDTSNDSWVSGTPIRVRLENESATVEQARQQARAAAASALASRNVGLPGRLLLSNPLTEIVPDPHIAEFQTFAYSPRLSETNLLTLTEFPLYLKSCDFGLGDTMGFGLTLRTVTGEVRTLHQDTAIPASRACPVGYGISDVIGFDGTPGGDVVLIVILNVFQIGFEGPDRRFIAIATSIPAAF